VVGPDDDVINPEGALDAAGEQLWGGGGGGGDPFAVDAQGNLVALGTAVGASLLILEAHTGEPLLDVTLPSAQANYDATQLAVAGDGTVIVLLANEASSPGLTEALVQIIAVDTTGNTMWTTPLDVTMPFDPAALTTHYGVFVDAAGTVVVTAGQITGLDLATGAIKWTLAPPVPSACLRPAVLGLDGAILATQCDGTLFLARDP
jgi:outer membrane protein assembly factor BamB